MMKYRYKEETQAKKIKINQLDLEKLVRVKNRQKIWIGELTGEGLISKLNNDLCILADKKLRSDENAEKFMSAINKPLQLYIPVKKESFVFKVPLYDMWILSYQEGKEILMPNLTRIAHHLIEEKGNYVLDNPLNEIYEENNLEYERKEYEQIKKIEIIIGSEKVSEELNKITGYNVTLRNFSELRKYAKIMYKNQQKFILDTT